MRIKGTGKWQLKIIEYLHGTTHRYTPAALRMCLDVRHGAVENALAGLLEIGAIKADPWKSGYAYRSPHLPATADVLEVRRRPTIVTTKS